MLAPTEKSGEFALLADTCIGLFIYESRTAVLYESIVPETETIVLCLIRYKPMKVIFTFGKKESELRFEDHDWDFGPVKDHDDRTDMDFSIPGRRWPHTSDPHMQGSNVVQLTTKPRELDRIIERFEERIHLVLHELCAPFAG